MKIEGGGFPGRRLGGGAGAGTVSAERRRGLNIFKIVGPKRMLLSWQYSLIFRTKSQPTEQVFGRTSLRTSGQKLRSGPPKSGKTSTLARTCRADVHKKKNFSLKKKFGLTFCYLNWRGYRVTLLKLSQEELPSLSLRSPPRSGPTPLLSTRFY